MALLYADYAVKVRGMLADSQAGATSFSDALVESGIRQALAEINALSGIGWVINGLDGQIIGTVPEELDTAMVWGGAGYAAVSRALDDIDKFSLNAADSSKLLNEWGEARLKEFRMMLYRYNPAWINGMDQVQQELIKAQTEFAAAQTAHEIGIESREAAAAAQAGADRVAEANRLDELRHGGAAWGKWSDPGNIEYPDGYERS